MMATISGYHVSEKLYESANSLVYRGRREADDRPVVLKMLKQAYPPPEKVAWFKREFEIIHSLKLPGVVKAYNLEDNQHRWVMVLEDFGGESLTRLKLAADLSVTNFLHLAIEVSEILGQIHQHYIIHKDINPANIVAVPPASIYDFRFTIDDLDQQSTQQKQTSRIQNLHSPGRTAPGKSKIQNKAWQVKLIDFGIATVLSRETPTLHSPNVLEGTLAYISPEQTGRMNRAIDYRTDFYSLGVTFYELLSGQLPFSATDPLEIIHSHIAKPPPPLAEIKPDIPTMLSKIVLKLLAKNAEDRYQSAHGLKADLESCLQQWQSTGSVAVFPIGQHDFSLGRFQIPQKLYGREEEIETLMAAFERVSSNSTADQPAPPCEMMLVSGYAGIGKSALVQEVYKPITRHRGYFITGKFDQFKRSTPYASLIQAFQSLIRQLLTESEVQIADWRAQLLAALGSNGQIIIEVIPEVELIIGPQPEVSPLPPAEAQNRFNLTFQNFIRVFARREHSLVIFLDDLQWADAASLNLIQLVLTTPELHYLFVIGAYRSNEVGPAHPLTLTLDKIRQAEVIVNHIALSPLKFSHINRLIADTLNCPPEKARSLARLLLTKTGGNPFFINEFLKSLYAEELLTFISANGQENGKCRWRWDLAQIQARGITDNVVELMATKMQKLNEKSQQLLRLAACIGNQFDLRTLATVYEKPPPDTAVDLQEAIAEGLILPLGETHKIMELDMPELADTLTVEYKFSHDRIQQAGYSLISTTHKPLLHRQIGQLLLQNTPAQQVEEKIFSIANQLNLGKELISSQSERDELAELNLMAGKKAKASAAYEPALEYLQIGLDLLNVSGEEGSWTRRHDLALSLYEEAAEAAYLCTRYDKTEQLVDVVLNRVDNLLDKIKVYETRIQAYIAQNKLSEAINTGLQLLELLDIHFPETPDETDIKRGLAETKEILANKSFDELANLPEMTDPYKRPAMRILSGISALAFFTAPKLSPLISFKMVNLSVEYGYTPESAFAYGSYGIMLGGIAGDLEASYQFGKLALTLLNRFNVNEFKARTLVIVKGLIWHWKEHIKAILTPSLEAYQIALENGDLQYAAFAIRMYCSRAYLIGQELTNLQEEIDKFSQAIGRLGQKAALQGNEVMQQAIANLIESSDAPYQLSGNYYDEAEMLPRHLEANDRGAMFALYFHKLILCYLFGAYQQALECTIEAEKYIETAVGTPFVPVYHFYDSLIRLALFEQSSPSEQEDILERVTDNQQKMQNWANHAPMNYLHKYHLVAAEMACLQNERRKAREEYFQAITLAGQNEYPHEQALAQELAARFYLIIDQPDLAHHYLQEAHYTYQQWGAFAKVEQLEKRHPEVFSQITPDTFESTLTITTTSDLVGRRAAVSNLDLASVLKASQALSSEILLNKLLATLMKIAIENAGAEVGYLILERQDQWVVEAEGAVGSENVAVLQSVPVAEQPLPMSIINYVIRIKENVVLKNASHQGAFTRDPYILSKQPKSVLCAPLLNQGRLTGMIYLENNLTSGAFTSERLTVLNLLSAQAAISIENATLYADLEENERKYRTLFEDSNDAIFITDPEGRMLDMNPAGLSLLGYNREEITDKYAIDFYVNKEDHNRFLEEIEGHDAIKDFELKAQKKDGTQMDCLLTATIRRADDGTILAYQGIVRDVTSRKQAERERLQLTAIQRELTVAQEIQRSLLPPAKPNWAGPNALCYSKPAQEVGGDFYAYHAFDDNRFAIAVGDVSGKGTPAALVMAVSLASFQAIIGQRLAPGELLTRLDNTIGPYTLRTNQNCALVYAEITPVSGGDQGGIMRVANAGCVTPIIRRANGTAEWVEVGGLPLGIGFSTELGYQESSLILSKRDLVILISDGVVEAHNAREELFGFDRFEQTVAQGPDTVEEMLEYLKSQVASFSGGIEANDDITIVVLQV